jgi:8-oxo-dGTP pyrophosphatase MutT (NUDIX family)
MKRKLEFERKSRREILNTPVFRLHEETSLHPETGAEGRYYVLDAPNWVNIIAITEQNELVMVRQWRHGTAAVELEIPAGALEAGEDPVAAATRELLEETGYSPKKAHLLGEARPNSAIQSNHCFTVLCEGCTLTGETHFDPGEQITHELMPMSELRDRVKDGTLRSGMMLVAILWWLDSRGAVAWP